MQVRIKLLGTLRKKRPPGGDTLELPEGATVEDALDLLEIPASHVQAVSVNGRLERDRGCRLSASDEVTILPPVSGG